MMNFKYDIAIVNRSFWPDFPVLGEALLTIAEELSEEQKVLVLSQGVEKIQKIADSNHRGKGVHFRTFLNPPKSSFSLARRILESMLFMIWVFIHLVKNRPKVVYVATDPPIVVPFIVFIYTRLFKASYIYHIQDIHPEITSIYLGRKGFFSRVLRKIDNITIRNARRVITLNEEMKNTIYELVGLEFDIDLSDNPAMTNLADNKDDRVNEIIYCGNAGRLQRIPLLIESIDDYLSSGGKLNFHFVGGGIYASDLDDLAKKHINFHYHGFLGPTESSGFLKRAKWALLPIDDSITKYAFPSKSSSYAASGLNMIGICGQQTSVAKWVINNNLGIVVQPDRGSLINTFWDIEACLIEPPQRDQSKINSFVNQFSIVNFSRRISTIIRSAI